MSQEFTPKQAGYLCAFLGRRDSYQVPMALEEHGLLREFVTDFYAGEWMRKLSPLLPGKYAEKLHNRHVVEINEGRVRTLLRVPVTQQIRHWLGTPRPVVYAQTARDFGRAVAATARKTRADLLLYHSYAWEAFTAPNAHHPKRVLFQYHPHMGFENSIYEEDAVQYPQFSKNTQMAALAGVPPALLDRLRNSWQHADLIICASSFTRRSLVWAGAEEKKCRVVPYGNDQTVSATDEAPGRDVFQALFVGTGNQRKGLHHLLLAWQRMRLAMPKKLVLVCRDISPELRALANQTPDVHLLPGVRGWELARLYAQSHLFVMPSLVEGFGQVYLEALTYGCPVLGTPNTALPDLGGEADGIFQTRPGNVEELTAKLQFLAELLITSDQPRAAARRCAQARSWRRFRDELIAALA